MRRTRCIVAYGGFIGIVALGAIGVMRFGAEFATIGAAAVIASVPAL